MEADSLPMIRILTKQYGKRRKNAQKAQPRLSNEQLFKLADHLEAELSAQRPAEPTKMMALQYMGALLVAFLVFTLPQRAQVKQCWCVLWRQVN